MIDLFGDDLPAREGMSSKAAESHAQKLVAKGNINAAGNSRAHDGDATGRDIPNLPQFGMPFGIAGPLHQPVHQPRPYPAMMAMWFF
jgi:hypothetical protein